MKTTKLSAGVYQVVDTDWAIMNDSHKCWWVAKIVGGLVSLENDDRYFVAGSREEAIKCAKELQMCNEIA